MPSSGTFTFQMANTSILFEAFDRIQIRPSQVDRHHLISARESLNLELIDWEDSGFNAWKLDSGTINLGVNTAVYALPANLVTLTELWYSVVNGGGSGVNQDRIMIPITRTQYAALTNKLQEGLPTQYWFQMLSPPQVTIWQVPAYGAPNYVLNWYGLQQMEDANFASGETPNVPRRAFDCLCARMAFRLCEKFGPANPQARVAMMQEKKLLADDAWAKMTRRDQEPGPTTIQPNIAAYGRLGR